MEAILEELKNRIIKLEERVKILENIQKCEDCDKIRYLYVCYGCGRTLCRNCCKYLETKSYNSDSVVRFFCISCYNHSN